MIDTYRDMLSDHLSIYNTGVGNRLNEIMWGAFVVITLGMLRFFRGRDWL